MEDRKYKVKFAAKKMKEGEWSRHTINRTGISRSTYFRWKRRINEQGLDTLLNKAKPGPKPTFHIKPLTAKMIIQWRKRYGWGPNRI